MLDSFLFYFFYIYNFFFFFQAHHVRFGEGGTEFCSFGHFHSLVIPRLLAVRRRFASVAVGWGWGGAPEGDDLKLIGSP